MTFALFDEGGKFLAGRIMSHTDTSHQIEMESGKRVKVKNANVMLQFEKPSPAELIAQAQALSPEIDLDLAWEFAPEDEFSFVDFARDYYDESAGVVQQVAILFRLFDAPHYFRRAGKGRFKKAPQEIVQAALLAIERKKQQQEQVDHWAQDLIDGVCAQPIREQLYKILFKPDKNALEYKAVVQASKQSQISPLELFKRAGAIESAYQFHWKRFLYEFFPKGADFPANLSLHTNIVLADLPVASVQAFSIDDSSTTEIDDALSVDGLGSGTVSVGIHIAVPGIAIQPGQAVDQLARNRLSTVYMPGWKMTMLPEHIVEDYTLIEGREAPVLSLYVRYDESTLEVKDFETKLERITVVKNLRHDLLEGVVTEQTLLGEATADYPLAQELAFLYQLSRHLKAQREVVRGKPETFNWPDYVFRLEGEELAQTSPNGDEKVSITVRPRGSALDLIVSEAMIVANSTWGGWLATLGVPGIYRSQFRLGAGVSVRMGTKPLPHAGIGVAQYAWSTSPLRRYTDLVNQWQLIACVQNGKMAALAAPFKPKDAELFAIISAFDATYKGYNDYQRGIERYWTLRYIQQQDIQELEVSVMKEGMVRANNLPLVFHVADLQSKPRGTVALVKILSIDELTLDIYAKLVHIVQEVGAVDEASEHSEEDMNEDDVIAAGPIAIAVETNDDEEADKSGEKNTN